MTKPMVFVGLLHYPVYNKHMEIVTTSITNLDVHDISRSSRTYGVENYYIIHPLESQQKLIREVMGYWKEGYGAVYNPDRKEAISRIKLIESLEKTIEDITKITGKTPKIITTDARTYPNTVGYKYLKEKISAGEEPYLLLFGTGWGMRQDLMESADHILEPIYGPSDYNHLSVRSAVAIILDRLLGESWY